MNKYISDTQFEYTKGYKLINLLMVVYTIISISRLIVYSIIALSWDSYEVTDWLINYQGGFVRRGFLGEVIFHVSRQTGLDPRFFIVFISILALIVLIFFICKQMKKQQLCWWILPLNVCMMGAYPLRKDYICMLFVLLTILSFVKINTTWKRVCATCLFSIIAMNFHECVFFIIYPFFFLAFYRDERLCLKPIFRTFLTLPILVMFVFIFLNKGSADIARVIHSSWNIPAMGDLPQTTIESLSWDLNYAIKFHIQENFMSPQYPVFSMFEKPLAWILTFIIMPNILFIKKVNKIEQMGVFIKVLLLQFIVLFPMLTVLSCDQSRIFFYWTVSSLLIYLYVPKQYIEKIFPSFCDGFFILLQQLCCKKLPQMCVILFMFVVSVSRFSSDPYNAFHHSVAGTYAISSIMSYEVAAICVKNHRLPTVSEIKTITKKH